MLVSCVFSREVWASILQKLNLVTIAPQPNVGSFASWWYKAIQGKGKENKQGLNSLIILVAWEIWKHRNDCVWLYKVW
jgi:hypothetical protein